MSLPVDILVSLIGGGLGGFITYWAESRKLRKEYQFQDNAERVVHELLNDDEWRLRTFKLIQHHLGGFGAADLRRLLVRAGAIRFMSKSGIELWGLIDRNRDRVAIARIEQDPVGVNDADLFGGEDGAGN